MDWTAYQTEALAAFEAAATADELADASVRYLGRRAELPQALRQIRDAETGRTLNTVRRALEEAQAAAEERLERRGVRAPARRDRRRHAARRGAAARPPAPDHADAAR